MRKIQGSNISFRITNDLKDKLTHYCIENGLHNSFVIRQALAAYLRKAATKPPSPQMLKPSCLRERTGNLAAAGASSFLSRVENG